MDDKYYISRPWSLIRIMSEETLKKVYNALKGEPQTPNEIADKINLNQKTVQGALLELVNTKKNIKWKKVGRYRLFWKVK
jgi:predicted transcriptional regulator